MSLIETESLVLKSYNLAEADKIVVFLTHDHGVVRGVAKGVKRLKSKFGSGLEPFSIVRVTYFQKEVTELVSIQNVELVRSYFTAAGDPEFLQKFSYLSELLITFSPPHDPNETLYRMATTCLETAADDLGSLLSIGVYFELWLLRIAGYLPDWGSCTQCNRTFDESEDASLASNFHLMCGACRRTSGSRVIGATNRAMYAATRRLSPQQFAEYTSEMDSQLKDLSQILKRIISHSIGREVTGEISLAVNN